MEEVWTSTKNLSRMMGFNSNETNFYPDKSKVDSKFCYSTEKRGLKSCGPFSNGVSFLSYLQHTYFQTILFGTTVLLSHLSLHILYI